MKSVLSAILCAQYLMQFPVGRICVVQYFKCGGAVTLNDGIELWYIDLRFHALLFYVMLAYIVSGFFLTDFFKYVLK